MSSGKDLVIAAAAGLIVLAAPAARAQVAPPQPIGDRALDAQIEQIIEKDAQLQKFDIDVDVLQGVVLLEGTVRTDEQKAQAARLATVTGVTRVQNDLVVDANAPMGTKAERAAAKAKAGAGKAAGATKDAAARTVDKTREVAGKTAAKTKEVAAATGEVITDAWITTKIKTKMIDEVELKNSDIDVDTEHNVVTLKGTVASAAGKSRAEEIARTTDGVKRVVNQLTVIVRQ